MRHHSEGLRRRAHFGGHRVLRAVVGLWVMLLLLLLVAALGLNATVGRDRPPLPGAVESGAAVVDADSPEAEREVGNEATPIEIHLFVVWPDATVVQNRIVHDLASSFLLLDLQVFDWVSSPPGNGRDAPNGAAGAGGNGEVPLGASHEEDDPRSRPPRVHQEDRYLMNLWRFYSGKGGWGKSGLSSFARQCGRGKFLAAVIADLHPVYATQLTGRGNGHVNQQAHEKTELYRRWSLGSFRVHGTSTTAEAEHDIRLLMHRTTAVYRNIAERLHATGRDRGSELLRRLKDAPHSLETTQDTHGFTFGDDITVWPSCEDFLFGLSTIPHLQFSGSVWQGLAASESSRRHSEAEVRVILWASLPQVSELPILGKGDNCTKCPAQGDDDGSVPCTDWPAYVLATVSNDAAVWAVASTMMGVPHPPHPNWRPTTYRVYVAQRDFLVTIQVG